MHPHHLITAVSVSIFAIHFFASAAPASPAEPDPDRSGLLAAIEESRHAFREASGGAHHAFNPGQSWLTEFDDAGFLARPEGGGWTWGLALSAYGREGAMVPVGRPLDRAVRERRLVYSWSTVLEEWFLNDGRGLEQGWTLSERPWGDTADPSPAPLGIALSVRGELRPEIGECGSLVRFLDAAGAVAVTYGGLRAWDADGVDLDVRFREGSEGLRIEVDDAAARYPVTIDPIAQQAFLKASNADFGDGEQFFFGPPGAIAISGDIAVFGAPYEDSSASGVDGDKTDNSLDASGAAYVFVRVNGVWTEQAYLKASNPDEGDQFGRSVAVSGETVAVGASGERSNASGVDGDQDDDSLLSAGAVYIFVRNGNTWTQQAYVKASNPDEGDGFGTAIDLDGDTLVVGSPFEESNATGIDGNQADDSAPSAGAVYVFTRSGSTWMQQAYLKANVTEASDVLGKSVAIDGDTIVAGSHGEDGSSSGVNGNEADNGTPGSGAAHVFVRSGMTWTRQAYLKASNPDEDDFFGSAVAISGDTVVVATAFEESSARGVNGNQADNSVSSAGAAYVFSRTGVNWQQDAYLKSSRTMQAGYFGLDVATTGDTVLVGAPGESLGNLDRSGFVYVFSKKGAGWMLQQDLRASNPGFGDDFGVDVDASGDTFIVFADGEDTTAPGSGAAYVFIPNLAPTIRILGKRSLRVTKARQRIRGLARDIDGRVVRVEVKDQLNRRWKNARGTSRWVYLVHKAKLRRRTTRFDARAIDNLRTTSPTVSVRLIRRR